MTVGCTENISPVINNFHKLRAEFWGISADMENLAQDFSEIFLPQEAHHKFCREMSSNFLFICFYLNIGVDLFFIFRARLSLNSSPDALQAENLRTQTRLKDPYAIPLAKTTRACDPLDS